MAKYINNTFYSIVLGLIILIDSLTTFYVFGNEANPLLLGVMKLFTLSLGEMMFWRTIVIWSVIFFLWKQNVENKYLILMYCTLYGICVVTTL